MTVHSLCFKLALLVFIKLASSECLFNKYPGKVYRSAKGGDTHKASGPKCKYLCDLNPKCQSATVRMIWGQGMVCEIMYDAPGDISTLDDDPDVVLYIKRSKAVSQCAVGYVEGPPDRHCYLYVYANMTWEQAETFCASNHSGAYLANVGSSQEDQFIHSLMTEYYICLGGRRDTSRVWLWSRSGQRVDDGFTNWASWAPRGAAQCLCKFKSGLWGNCECDILGPHAVCEYDRF